MLSAVLLILRQDKVEACHPFFSYHPSTSFVTTNTVVTHYAQGDAYFGKSQPWNTSTLPRIT